MGRDARPIPLAEPDACAYAGVPSRHPGAALNIELNDRTALISGGSMGLGLATARRFARSGARVAILARGAEALASARRLVADEREGAEVLALRCDVTSPDDLARSHEQVVRELGPVDILVNNAGGHSLGSFLEVDDAQWAHDIDIKLMATVRLTRLCWPAMVERRWGRVINTLNTLAKAPIAGSCPTSVTRAAQLALTKVLAEEGGPHNVLVNALLVGLIRSDQIDRIQRQDRPGQPMHGYTEGRLKRIPLGRIGEPEEFANAACFLASDAASYVTGSAFGVDGGMGRVI